MDDPANKNNPPQDRLPHGEAPKGRTTGGPAPKKGRVFTLDELARYDGREGRPAYVAYGGLVFDVSGSMRWRGGRHQDRHDAGRDLTAEFDEAPHSRNILLRVPIVGRLAK